MYMRTAVKGKRFNLLSFWLQQRLLSKVTVTPQTRVLDVGCGLGGTMAYLVKVCVRTCVCVCVYVCVHMCGVGCTELCICMCRCDLGCMVSSVCSH